MLWDWGSTSWLTDCWNFGAKTNQQLRRFRPGEAAKVYDYINKTAFDPHVADPRQPVVVCRNFPGEWPIELEAVYVRGGLSYPDMAAMLLGNLYCRAAIARPDYWYTINTPVIGHHPREYRLIASAYLPILLARLS
jgi:hypothetical protein